tara:strand:+ start:56 stop:700 length:645 start_codon:yes stop_codon:yes gene_type:complete
MCGRYYNFISKDELSYLSNNELINKYKNFNIVPTSEVAIVIDNQIVNSKWGFYPTWLKEMKDSKPLINARLETVLEKKTFKTPFEKRRCIVLMSGWYEWKQEGGSKIPFAFYKQDYEPIKVAGIYNQRSDDSIEVCILTTSAKNKLNDVHERMPVVLNEKSIYFWNDIEIDINNLIENINLETESIKYHRVDIAVNNPKNNNENLYKEYTELPF